MNPSRAIPAVALAVILGTGLWLRASGLDNMEFKADEAVAMEMARGIAEGRFTSTGLLSSVGLPNPPLFIYLLSIPMLINSSPLFTASFIALCGTLAILIVYRIGTILRGRSAGLAAAALMAVSPWAVIYSRKIWAQDLLQLMASMEMLAILKMGRRDPGSRAASFAAPLVALLAAQIHMSGTTLVLILALVLSFRIRRPRWGPFIAGSLVGVAPLLPYVLHLWNNGFPASLRAGTLWRGAPGLSSVPDRIAG
ncbi:glycosyltransferase family 39 protein, partial [Thermodesulfobacteriota bacterium]